MSDPDGLVKPMFLGALSGAMTMSAQPNLVVQKICHPSFEPDINEFICRDEGLIAQATGIAFSQATLRSVISAISKPLFGHWRDTTGNNKALILIGEVTETICVLCAFIMACQWPTNPKVFAIIESVIGGISGAHIAMLGCDCIIIEGSKSQDRTMRLQKFGMIHPVAFLLANLGRGLVLTSVGYKIYFFFILLLRLANIWLLKTSVKDVRRVAVVKESLPLTNKIKALFKPRPNRIVVWAMLLTTPIFFAFFHGQMMLQSYYMQQSFNMTVKEGTVHGTWCLILGISGSYFMPKLLINRLKLSDFQIGILSASFAVLTSTLSALATTRTEIFLIPALDILRYNIFSLPQSILSKCIKNDELGMFSGLSSIVGIVLPFFVNSLYQSTFSATSQTMPGAIFFITAFGNSIILLLFCISAYVYCGEDGKENDKKNIKEKKN